MLPGSHETDVDIVACSTTGKVVISVGIDNSVCLWRFDDKQAGAGTRETLTMPNYNSGEPIVATTVSSNERWIAICSASGLVQVWDIADDQNPPIAREVRQVPKEPLRRITAAHFHNRSSMETIPSQKLLLKWTRTSQGILVLILRWIGHLAHFRLEYDRYRSCQRSWLTHLIPRVF